MSDYTAISNVNKTLISLLWNSIKEDSQANSIVATEDQISLSSPKAIESEPTKNLSLFLYQITELTTMRNQPTPLQESNKIRPPPLYLALHYLVTPYTQNTEKDDLLLGKIMQIFADNAILRGSILYGSLAENGADLKIVMDPLVIDDLNKLWAIFGTQYRLCVSYSVAPVIIELTREEEAARVIEQKAEYTFIKRKKE
jgi:hypothetical protein